jgi:hypothetical protein
MHKTTIENTEDVIDSRDVIARLDELESCRDDHETDPTGGHFSDEDAAELAALRALADEAEDSPDWIHGETLIRRSYFVDYIAELINDCYEMPKEMNSGQWPYRHMTIDYEAAANEAEQDYMSVDFDGVEYLIRCV